VTEAGDAWVEEKSPTMGVVILGILGLLLGLLGVCTLVFYLGGQYLSSLAPQGQENELLEMQRALEAEPMARIVTLLSVVMSVAFGIVFIIGSVGLLGLRRWAWKLSVACVTTFLIWSIMFGIFNHLTLGARRAEILEDFYLSEDFKAMPQSAQSWTRFSATTLPWICMGGFGLAYLGFLGGLLVPGIRRQFAPPEPEDQAEP
jgi:hypothetical protein